MKSPVRINGEEVQVTQGISQSSASSIVPLVDDMLQSHRMTIEDLLDAFEVIFRNSHLVAVHICLYNNILLLSIDRNAMELFWQLFVT